MIDRASDQSNAGAIDPGLQPENNERTAAVTPPAFDYSQLPEADREPVRATAQRIHDAVGEALHTVGSELRSVKSRLGHGQWGAWLRAEFRWSASQALNLMRAAELVGKNANFAVLQPSVAYLLAAPSTPEEARNEIAARLESGETGKDISVKAVKETIAKAQERSPPQPRPLRVQVVEKLTRYPITIKPAPPKPEPKTEPAPASPPQNPSRVAPEAMDEARQDFGRSYLAEKQEPDEENGPRRALALLRAVYKEDFAGLIELAKTAWPELAERLALH
jgi:hypothetical protein